ncbi:hypothetical protein OGAPHI_000127 [Ogataea philodendri]|uniref:Protein-lysine N-methyltransferase EFM3 n=1 Tax=Ogataea philodendri TaxID=1378263 RepID=A0A9P8TAI9_9ASCO|nr:uncharacterized protein OGAPHI_000127 [Ogataea philodendri]KAH3671941.1 hypothetical protein OGAPHI_000127 [Ogataea philodendri]
MDRIVRQIWQRVPVARISISGDIDQTRILDVLNKIENYNAFYCKEFLKKLIFYLEDKNEEINDELYEKLSELLSARPLNPTDTEVVSYCVVCKPGQGDQMIFVREAPNVISGLGTTGLRTWEASLYLSQYLLNSDQCDLSGQKVLELGCGTGLIGMALSKYHPTVKKVFMTDGDSQLIDNLPYNLQLNDIPVDSPKLHVSKLWWGEDGLPDSEINTIVAADVTYDSSILDDLISVIYESMTENKHSATLVTTAYIAATVRNENTIADWEKLLNMGTTDHIWEWSIMKPLKWEGIWYPDGTPEIRLYRLARV